MAKVSSNSVRVTLVLVIVGAVIVGLHRPAGALSATTQQESRFRVSQAEERSSNDPMAILAAARIIYVRSRTVFVKSEVIENELHKRADFQRAGLVLTTDPEAADLTMEVRRANLTTEYPYVVVDSKTRFIVASGRVNSLFGTAAGKIAKRFMKQVQMARSGIGPKSNK